MIAVIWYAVLISCLFAAAFFAAIMGVGGGVLYTPLQIFFGIDIHSAAATSLFLIIILSAAATIVYRKAKRIDWSMAVVLVLISIAGGFAGGVGSNFLSSDFLLILLTAVVVFAGINMITRKGTIRSACETQPAWYMWQREVNGESYAINIIIAVPASFLAGAVSGLVGVGGGIIHVPMLVLLFFVPIDVAIATSAFMVGLTALGGFTGHLIAGNWDWRLSLIAAPAVFIGARFGAHHMLKMEKTKLKKIFGVFMFLVAAGLILKMLY